MQPSVWPQNTARAQVQHPAACEAVSCPAKRMNRLIVMLTTPAFVGTSIPLVTQAQKSTVEQLPQKSEPPDDGTTRG
jgi:hypothetical protein